MDMDRRIMLVQLAEEQDKLDDEVVGLTYEYSRKAEEANNALGRLKTAIEKRDAVEKVRKHLIGE